MTSRTRNTERTDTRRPDKNRRGEPRRTREPAIWRGADAPGGTPERMPEHVEGRAFIRWRYVSGFVVLALIVVLVVFFASDSFYVHPGNVAVGGLETMTTEEVYQLAQIADTQIFWVDPEQVRRNLLQSPNIADAQVILSWGSPMVQILVQERQPAIVWQQGATTTWIDVQGRVMDQRGDRPDLLRIIAEGDPTGVDRIDPDVVNGALQLRELLPNAHQLQYTNDNGLGYVDPGGWEVWLGTGTNMPEKVLISNAIVANLQGRGITPAMINVTNPDKPFYTARSGR